MTPWRKLGINVNGLAIRGLSVTRLNRTWGSYGFQSASEVLHHPSVALQGAHHPPESPKIVLADSS
ncbi:hypothetical protein [Ferrimicrobium acidiphilum]|uniref:hypothetical protein n=1 Tax=Ferrimicrobium acidiphilum TaxID=121039 RepID=UPI0034DCDFCC